MTKIREREQTQEATTPQLDARFVSEIKGRTFVQYAGLLDLAHQMGLETLTVAIHTLPTVDNPCCICVAMAKTRDGRIFSEIGDATPANVNKMIAPHFIRMAATRAKARALRDLTNIGMTCLEELADMEEEKAAEKAAEKAPPTGGATESPLALLRAAMPVHLPALNRILEKTGCQMRFPETADGVERAGKQIQGMCLQLFGGKSYDRNLHGLFLNNPEKVFQELAQTIKSLEEKRAAHGGSTT
jgi:hypothetical protein